MLHPMDSAKCTSSGAGSCRSAFSLAKTTFAPTFAALLPPGLLAMWGESPPQPSGVEGRARFTPTGTPNPTTS